jgi:hypothetical protein
LWNTVAKITAIYIITMTTILCPRKIIIIIINCPRIEKVSPTLTV